MAIVTHTSLRPAIGVPARLAKKICSPSRHPDHRLIEGG
jgi:hypothetical protein